MSKHEPTSEEIDEFLGAIGEKLRAAIDTRRNTIAELRDEIEAIDDAWRAWDLDALVRFDLLSERDVRFMHRVQTPRGNPSRRRPPPRRRAPVRRR